jgi:hypothetical protein
MSEPQTHEEMHARFKAARARMMSAAKPKPAKAARPAPAPEPDVVRIWIDIPAPVAELAAQIGDAQARDTALVILALDYSRRESIVVPVRVRQIAAQIAASHGVPDYLIFGETLLTKVVRARHEFWRQLREAGFSYPQIGRWAGRDHSTVILGVRRAEERSRVAA